MDENLAFVRYYDRLVGANYSSITNFIIDKIKEYKPDSTLIVDLGCGSGSVAVGLVKAGYDLIGLDSSTEMLMLAKQKQVKFNIDPQKLLLLCQDMCDFELYGTVDVIYSTLDCINYITDLKELNNCFANVNNYLNYGGLFLFDINTYYKYKTVLSNNIFSYDFKDLYCIWENNFDSSSKICEFDLKFFEKQGTLYKRSDEKQYQRFYSINQITKLLNNNYMQVLNVWDDYSNAAPCRTTQRYTILARTLKHP